MRYFFLTSFLITSVVFLFLLLPLAAQGNSLIDINTASAKELEKIIGIGPVLAQRIIEARPFNSLDDLIKVKGIGEKTLQKIKDQGLAYVGKQTQQPAKEPTENSSQLSQQTTEKPVGVGLLPTYLSGIFLNEILPSPEGPDETEEWIEIFNQNNFEVDLSGWKIKDSEGRITTYTFPLGTKISSKGYLVLSRPATKITLNNTNDGLNLIKPNGEIGDSLTYEKAPRNQSYSKTESGWLWSEILTPGKANIASVSQGEEPSSLEGKEEKFEDGPLTAKFFSEKGVAGIGEKLLKSSSLSVFLIAFIVAIFSGIIILLLKKQFDKMSPTG